MQAQRTARGHVGRQTGRRGFTLIEVMIVVAVVGIVAAMAIPSFRRVMEQARVDNAASGLRSIYAAQRVYRLDNASYSSDLTTLTAGGLLDPSLTSSSGSFAYQVTGADTQTFSAAATRVGSDVWSGTLAIDQNGQITGGITENGVLSIAPSPILTGDAP